MPRTELTLDDGPGLDEPTQRVDDRRLGKTESPRGIARDERPVRACVPAQERDERIRVVVRQERCGQPKRKTDAESVAITARVLGRDEAPLSGDTNVQHATFGHERRDPVVDRLGLRAASRDLLGREVPEAKEQLVDGVGVARGALADEVLERKLELGHAHPGRAAREARLRRGGRAAVTDRP